MLCNRCRYSYAMVPRLFVTEIFVSCTRLCVYVWQPSRLVSAYVSLVVALLDCYVWCLTELKKLQVGFTVPGMFVLRGQTKQQERKQNRAASCIPLQSWSTHELSDCRIVYWTTKRCCFAILCCGNHLVAHDHAPVKLTLLDSRILHIRQQFFLLDQEVISCAGLVRVVM